jgi:large subunit ribosomal protein L18e
MKTKTKIEKQLKRKTNTELVDTIIAAKKKPKWVNVAASLSTPSRNRISVNLSDIDKQSKEGEGVVVPGKVLSQGDLTKKIKIVALNFSEKAKEKIKKAGCEGVSILEEIKSNPDFKDIKIIIRK